MKVGDKLVCIRDYSASVSVLFNRGSIYSISYIINKPWGIYYKIDNNINNIGFTIDRLFIYFESISEVRRKKLEKLEQVFNQNDDLNEG